MRATRLSVANYNTTLSSDSLETGTGSSNSLRSATQSSIYGILWRDERNPRVCGLPRLLKVPGESTIGAFFGLRDLDYRLHVIEADGALREIVSLPDRPINVIALPRT
jgi:hypothetical protein